MSSVMGRRTASVTSDETHAVAMKTIVETMTFVRMRSSFSSLTTRNTTVASASGHITPGMQTAIARRVGAGSSAPRDVKDAWNVGTSRDRKEQVHDTYQLVRSMTSQDKISSRIRCGAGVEWPTLT